MSIVYIEIFIATRRRLRERARASRINAINLKSCGNKDPATTQQDQESISSETNHNEHPNVSDSQAHAQNIEKRKKKEKRLKAKDSIKQEKRHKQNLLKPPTMNEDSVTDIQDPSTESMKANGSSESPVHCMTNCSTTPAHSKNTLNAIGDVKNKNNNTVYQFIEEKQKISLSKERRAARTLGIIMGVFIFCWVPFFVLYIVTPFCPTCCPSEQLIDFLTWLGYINSALNPIIYTIFNLDYRRAFKKLLGIKN